MAEQKVDMRARLSNLFWGIKGLWGDNKMKSDDRFFLKKTKGMIPDYIRNYEVKKLNIGSQDHPFADWLNVDIFGFEGVAFMDATKPFPIVDNSFDYIYSEHMIEHITYDEGNFMLKECHRIMKKNAKIRIVTPGFDKLALMSNLNPEGLKSYIENLVQPTFKTKITDHVDFCINYLCYNYKHRFIYSEPILKHLLTLNGFKNIKSYKMFESEDPNLRNLEIHSKIVGEFFYDFESIYIEAEK